MSQAELADLRERAEAAGMTASELTRAAVTRVRTWTADDRQAVGELTRAVARVGSLANQIARAAHIARRAGTLDATTAERLVGGLAVVDRRLRDILGWRPPRGGRA